MIIINFIINLYQVNVFYQNDFELLFYNFYHLNLLNQFNFYLYLIQLLIHQKKFQHLIYYHQN